ncbi:MAG: GNAT family N-acetyltransferase [Xanthomonadales bacterium]|nr:hypothetical protein [Xanthomonadales bacterium]MCC6593512.1 GNAT family N-acetyltransferase [Xanthomonadales bacterium]MCE7932363.1 GNAT family N-acetyltransferase [Xanthomonadales bacterium PRO6]
MSDELRIEDWQPRWAADFLALNLEWIERWFRVEAADRATLEHPQQHILAPGGAILFALAGEDVLGCVALKPVADGVHELTKMAVRADRRGGGIGAALMQAAIARARALGLRELLLDTHSSLQPAIVLYRRFGFVDAPLRCSPYARSDVSMRLPL